MNFENGFQFSRKTWKGLRNFFQPNATVLDEESSNEKIERMERIKAAQTRRDAGAARANVSGDDSIHPSGENQSAASKITIFTKLRSLPKIGIPFRMIHEHLEQKRAQKKYEHEQEARRVWDMLQILEPGTRVKLKGLKSKYGGIDYNNKLATVQAGVGNRFSVKLDLVEKDGAVREGQGTEIKIGLQNMTIWNADIEAVLAAEELAAKEAARKERDQVVKDLLAFRFRKLLPIEKRDVDIDGDFDRGDDSAQQLAQIDYAELSAHTPEVVLRAFHRQERMKCNLGKWDNSQELFDKIENEWKERIQAAKKAERDLKDAEAAIRVGSVRPAIRNEIGSWVVNPSFSIAYEALNEGRQLLLKHFATDTQQGFAQGYSHALHQLILDIRVAKEKSGPSELDDFYVGNTLFITHGIGQGQDAIIRSYEGSSRTACLSEWNTAVPDSSSTYEIFGSEWQPLHFRGKSRGCTEETFVLASDADQQHGFYCGMLLRIVSGPGKYQVAFINQYDGENKVAFIGKWRYEKSLFQRVLDQDDDDIPTILPTIESTYEVQQLDQATNRSVSLHYKGKVTQSNGKSLQLSRRACDTDVYTGKCIMITNGSGWGQKAKIIGYLGTKRLATIDSWQLAHPELTSKYSVLKMPKDQEIFYLYQQLQTEQRTAVEKAAALEAGRKLRIRARFRAAARIALWAERSGDSILEKRRLENSKSWDYYEQNQAIRPNSSQIVFHDVKGRPIKLTWSNIVLATFPFSAVNGLGNKENILGPKMEIPSEQVETISWNGHLIQAPKYSSLHKNRDGSVEQPIKLLDISSQCVIYAGPTYDWRTWKSLLEESSPFPGRSDVFEWRGRAVLQPGTTLGEEGEDIFTIVDEASGMLLYCGPHLEPEECGLDAEDSGMVRDQGQEQNTLSTDDTSRDASLIQALSDSIAQKLSDEMEISGDKIWKAHDKLDKLRSVDSGKETESGNTVHVVGGQIWDSADDPMLWKSLLEEGLSHPTRPDVFVWRDMTILQPYREGEYQRVVTEDGKLIYYGVNPNEEQDFPGEKIVEGAAQKDFKNELQQATLVSQFGTYSGAHLDGEFEGEGTFTVISRFIFSLI